MYRHLILHIAAMVFTLFYAPLYAEGAKQCVTNGLIVKGSTAGLYGISTSTGAYKMLQTQMGTQYSLNAMGYNPTDGLLYAWSDSYGTLVKINEHYQIESLKITGNTQVDFYAGDIDPAKSVYYGYTRNMGLYKIPLNPEDKDYLKVIQLSTLNTDHIYDFSFHPYDGFAYAVNAGGDLVQIDPDSGEFTLINEHAVEKGTYGASYFDNDENLYVVRNNDGNVYKISLTSHDLVGDYFTTVAASNISDGAGCIDADEVDHTVNIDLDFGDAPSSYGTYINDDGAVHDLSVDPDLYLGKSVDGEGDASAYPLSDDKSDDNNDDDGVQFVSELNAGTRAIVLITASKSGYLSAWLDSKGDGTFNADDKVITQAIEAGESPIHFTVPEASRQGPSWMRFRFSSSEVIDPTGGAYDGEVEDYSVTIAKQAASVTYYPSAKDFTTIAYEDSWPLAGDYDMNDVVINMRTAITRNAKDEVSAINVKGNVAALGTDYSNGFAINIPGIPSDIIDKEHIKLSINDVAITKDYIGQEDYTPLSANLSSAVITLMDNIWDYVSSGESCTYYRTEDGCGSDIQANFDLEVPLKTPIKSDVSGVLDPFIFATPDAWRGDSFSEPPGRGLEIHLKNKPPTEAANPAFFGGLGADASIPEQGFYYQNDQGMPWAIETGTGWQYPLEYRDLNHAYPAFMRYVESGGAQYKDWHSSRYAVNSELFTR